MTVYNLRKESTLLPKRSNIYTIASGKGGVGKTWFTISLAHSLALEGKKVLIFDGDLGLANIDIQIGLSPQYDLEHYLTEKKSLSEIRTPYPFDLSKGSIDIIAGRSGSNSLVNLPFHRREHLIQSLHGLASGYDYVFIDLPAGVEEAVYHFIEQTKTCFMVVTHEPTSLTDSYAFMKLAFMKEFQIKFELIINSAETRSEGEKTYATLKKACQSFLDFKPDLTGIIRRDKKVLEALKSQTPLLIRYPNANASEDINAIAKKLLRSPEAIRA